MKKLFALLMALMLALPSVAGAEGLGGLGLGDGAGFGGLPPLPTEVPNPNMGVVPDAADFTGTTRNTLQKNYEYAMGRFFTAYIYALPVDVAAFTDAYVAEAEKNGFTVEQLTVEGHDARQITWTDGAYALLVPNYGGQVLLLVQNGMTFGKPKPEGYYLEFEYNGIPVSAPEDTLGTNHTKYSDFSGNKLDYYYVSYRDGDEPITKLVMAFPDTVKAGREYTIGMNSYKKGYDFELNGVRLVNMVVADYCEFKEKADYFKLSVISVETVYDKVFIEADFEGRFKYGAITITNGHFNLWFERDTYN